MGMGVRAGRDTTRGVRRPIGFACTKGRDFVQCFYNQESMYTCKRLFFFSFSGGLGGFVVLELGSEESAFIDVQVLVSLSPRISSVFPSLLSLRWLWEPNVWSLCTFCMTWPCCYEHMVDVSVMFPVIQHQCSHEPLSDISPSLQNLLYIITQYRYMMQYTPSPHLHGGNQHRVFAPHLHRPFSAMTTKTRENQLPDRVAL